MKYLFSLILFFCAFIVNAQVDSVISKVADAGKAVKTEVVNTVNTIDTSSNFKHIYTDVKTGITALAQGLKVGVEHVYMVLVKQQIVNSIVYLIVLILAIICIVICYKQWGKIEVISTSYSSEVKETRPLVAAIISGILGLILTLTFLFNVSDMIMGFVNPEYGAIQQIISVVKTGNLETCK